MDRTINIPNGDWVSQSYESNYGSFVTNASLSEIGKATKVLIVESGDQRKYFIAWPKVNIAGLYLAIKVSKRRIFVDVDDIICENIVLAKFEGLFSDGLSAVYEFETSQAHARFGAENIREILWENFQKTPFTEMVISRNRNDSRFLSVSASIDLLSGLAIAQIVNMAKAEMEAFLTETWS